MENLVRNSAKYGTNREPDTFIVHLDLDVHESAPDLYRVQVWDNLTAYSDGLFERFEENYARSLIDEESGEIAAEEWGFQEMLTCGDFLINRTDESPGLNGDREVPSIKPVKVGDHLGVGFELCRARVVAVVSYPSVPFLSSLEGDEVHRSGIRRFESIQELTRPDGSYQYALVDAKNAVQWGTLLEMISRFHRQLPNRLLLVTSPEQCSDLSACVRRWEREVFELDQGLPERRVFVASEAELAQAAQEGCESFILAVAQQWLRASKGLRSGETKVRLVVSIQGDRKATEEKWIACARRAEEATPDVLALFELYVVRFPESADPYVVYPSRVGYKELTRLFDSEPHTFLLYDNHRCLLRSREWSHPDLRFWQSWGAKSLRTLQLIDNPPADEFHFALLLLGLVEAGLTRVILIDERVGEAAMQLSGREFDRMTQQILHDKLNAAGCFPLYSVRDQQTRTFISSRIEEAVKADQEAARAGGGAAAPKLPLPSGEGLVFEDVSKSGVMFRVPQPTDDDENDVSEVAVRALGDPALGCEFVVIHQGVIDRVHEVPSCEDGRSASRDWLRDLYSITPSVVITSGRGRRVRHAPKDCPFLEFSIVKLGTYPEVSKYDLVSALVSAKGIETAEVNREE